VLSYTLASSRQPWTVPLTLSLTTEFIGSAMLDAWIEGRAVIKKKSGSITFATCEIFCGSSLISQSSGVFKFLVPKER
jgi:hypothetical protein